MTSSAPRPFTFDTIFDGDRVIAPPKPKRHFTAEEPGPERCETSRVLTIEADHSQASQCHTRDANTRAAAAAVPAAVVTEYLFRYDTLLAEG